MENINIKTLAIMLFASALLALNGCGSTGESSDSGFGDTTVPAPPIEPEPEQPVEPEPEQPIEPEPEQPVEPEVVSCVPDFDVMMVVGYPYQPQGALDDGLNGAGISSLAFSLDGSKAYTITTDNYIQNDLMSIDPATGVGTTIAQVENDDHISDLSTQPGTGALFALYWGELEEVNTTDASVTVLGNVSDNSPSGIAFDTNGTLYQVDQNSTGFNRIFTLDPSDGSNLDSILVQGVAQDYRFMGLGYNPDDGLLYAASRTDPGDIYTIDPSTGVATLVGSVDCPVGGTCYLHDIDFHPTTGVMYGAIGGANSSTNPDDLVGAFVEWGCQP